MRIGVPHGEAAWRVPGVPLVAGICVAFVAAGLFGCAAQPGNGEEGKNQRSQTKCPAFTRPDTVRTAGGMTLRACTDRHGNVVCHEAGGRLRCRTGDGASLINEDGDW